MSCISCLCIIEYINCKVPLLIESIQSLLTITNSNNTFMSDPHTSDQCKQSQTFDCTQNNNNTFTSGKGYIRWCLMYQMWYHMIQILIWYSVWIIGSIHQFDYFIFIISFFQINPAIVKPVIRTLFSIPARSFNGKLV